MLRIIAWDTFRLVFQLLMLLYVVIENTGHNQLWLIIMFGLVSHYNAEEVTRTPSSAATLPVVARIVGPPSNPRSGEYPF
jgi:hypothetical protein